MSKGKNGASSEAPKERPWQDTSEAATEWGPDSITDLTEGVLYTTGEHSAYAKDLEWEDEGVKKSVTKHYAYLRANGQTLPIRINKYSMDELSKAWGTAVGNWDRQPVVVKVDRTGKWPFCVVVPKPGIQGKGKARRKA